MLTIFQVTGEALEAYPNEPRADWVKAWPGQAVLCVTCYYWTTLIHKAIQKGNILAVINVSLTHLMPVVQTRKDVPSPRVYESNSDY